MILIGCNNSYHLKIVTTLNFIKMIKICKINTAILYL